MLKLTQLECGIYRDTMDRYWLGFRGPARVWKDGARVPVENHPQFLMLTGLSGPTQAEDYEVVAPGLDLTATVKDLADQMAWLRKKLKLERPQDKASHTWDERDPMDVPIQR